MRPLHVVLLALALTSTAAAQTPDEEVVWFAPADSLLDLARASWQDMGTPVAAFDTLLNVIAPTMLRAIRGDEPRTGYAGGVRPLAVELLPGGTVTLGATALGPRPDIGLGDEVNRLSLVGRVMADEHGARAVGVAFDGRGMWTDRLFGPAFIVFLGDADGHSATYVVPLQGAPGTKATAGAPRWAFGQSPFYDAADVLPRRVLKGPWPDLPADAVSGRLATPEDVAAGRAVFALGVQGGAAAPANVMVPQYAVLVEDGRAVPGVLVQAEEALGIRSAGFRPVGETAASIVLLDTLVLLGTDRPTAD